MRDPEQVFDKLLEVIPLTHVHRVLFIDDWTNNKTTVLKHYDKQILMYTAPEILKQKIASEQFRLIAILLTKYFSGDQNLELSEKLKIVFHG